jgi:hypothetical protein
MTLLLLLHGGRRRCGLGMRQLTGHDMRLGRGGKRKKKKKKCAEHYKEQTESSYKRPPSNQWPLMASTCCEGGGVLCNTTHAVAVKVRIACRLTRYSFRLHCAPIHAAQTAHACITHRYLQGILRLIYVMTTPSNE